MTSKNFYPKVSSLIVWLVSGSIGPLTSRFIPANKVQWSVNPAHAQGLPLIIEQKIYVKSAMFVCTNDQTQICKQIRLDVLTVIVDSKLINLIPLQLSVMVHTELSDCSGYVRGHKATPSQESNTLSQMSCTTTLSTNSDRQDDEEEPVRSSRDSLATLRGSEEDSIKSVTSVIQRKAEDLDKVEQRWVKGSPYGVWYSSATAAMGRHRPLYQNRHLCRSEPAVLGSLHLRKKTDKFKCLKTQQDVVSGESIAVLL